MARSCRFEQRFELEAESASPEWKGLNHDNIGPGCVEGSEQRLPARSPQVLVDRLTSRTHELLEARVAGPDRRKLNDALGPYGNGPRGRFSAQHKGNPDVCARDGVNQAQSALQVPDAE